MRKIIRTFILIASGSGLLLGCAGGPQPTREVARQDYQHVTRIQYGIVADAEVVGLHSQAAQGALVGGLAGLSYSHHANLGDVAVGAVAGALLTRAVERKRAKQVTVELVGGGQAQVVVNENADVRVGDCVAVEDGPTANVRSVSPVMCEAGTNTQHYANHAVSQAEACHEAKMELLDTSTEEDFNRAERKVRVLCGH